jgi:rhodanese-related sulfurtransferase
MATQFEQMVEQARRNVREVSPAEAREMLNAEAGGVIVDVREVNEWDLGHIPGAVNVPLGQLGSRADASSPNADSELTGRADALIVTQCATGKRSILAADLLQKLGYRNVVSMRGGFVSWARQGLPID